MNGWLCPACARRFGRRNQSHVCAPAMSLEAFLSRRPPLQRAICEAVLGHLRMLGDVAIEPVEVGILVKRARTFAELRPMKSRVRLSMLHSRPIEHDRVSRRYPLRGSRVANFVDLYHAGDVDDQLRAWLAESYADSPL